MSVNNNSTNSLSNSVANQRRLETERTSQTASVSKAVEAAAAEPAAAVSAAPEVGKTAASADAVDASRVMAKTGEDAAKARLLGTSNDENSGTAAVRRGLSRGEEPVQLALANTATAAAQPKPKPRPRPNGSTNTVQNNTPTGIPGLPGGGPPETGFA